MVTADSATGPAQQIRFFEALRNRDFRLLWLASWLSYHGNWIEIAAVGWIVLELTNSPWLIGVVGFSRMVPMPVLGLFAGILTDKYPGKRLIVLGQVINLFAITGLMFLLWMDVLQFWHILVVAINVGIGWTLDFPARRVIVLDIVGQRRLTNAMIMDSTAFIGSIMMGPIYAGLLLTLGRTVTIAVVLAFYFAGFVVLFFVRIPKVVATPARENPLRMIKEGMVHVLTNQLLLGVFLITVVVNLFLFPFVAMMPVFARDVLVVGPVLFGILGAASGLGSLVGLIYLATKPEVRGPARLFAYGSIFAISVMFLFTVSRNYALSLALLFVAGLGTAGFAAMQFPLVLKGAPEAMRGRALGVLMVAIGMAPVGILITGAASEAWGAPVAIGINCIIGLVLLSGILAMLKVFRQVETFPSEQVSVAPDDAYTIE